MSRSVKKGPYVEERLINRINAMNASGERQSVKTWSRSSTIFPEMVGHTIAVHNRIHHGRHGRLQTRRVRSHAYFQRPRRRKDHEIIKENSYGNKK